MTNIILCGGNGTRLWPISRTKMPKQFVKLFGNKSLFQLTIQRNAKICDKTFIVSNTEQYFLALNQLKENSKFKDSKFLLEPIGRNTAPAIALACFAMDKDEIVLITPSDHLIKDETSYIKAIQKAKLLAEQNYLVTFGLTPTHPETGYGYIEANGEDVKAFHEKPDKATAEKYLKQNTTHYPLPTTYYFWNSGIFMFKAGLFLEELKKYAPKIYKTSKEAFENSIIQNSKFKIQNSYMEAIPEDSIDYAVMEKSKKVKVVPVDMKWSDLGSFDSLSSEFEIDNNNNTKDDNLITIDSKNNFIYSNERTIALADIQDLIIVDTPDALLITKKGSSQKVKQIVKELKSKNSHLPHIHITTHRPWGTYTVLEDTNGYKIKKIVVHPGKRLSLQKHFHRSEHWVVVSGTATVIKDNQKYLVRPNESTYIKMGEIHRLENEGKIDVVLIEVQVGQYTGEDDIIRLEDDYKRN